MKPVFQSAPSLFESGRNCLAVAHADRMALLVDGEAYFKAFAQAAERAQHSIIIIAWDFNSSACLRFDGDDRREPPARLGDFLNWLARRRRGLQIFVLDWDYPMLYASDREFSRDFGLGWQPHRRVHVRYDDTHPLAGSHHQKIVVIDGNLAFVGGLDLTARRWDTPCHGADEARRIHGDESYPPFHDLMVAVDGEAARVLAGIARERWQVATEQILAPASGDDDPWPPELLPDLTDVDIAIARTMPATNGRPGTREVEALYLDMIAAARRYIYIENQYFTSYRIGEALAARLAEPDGPEIILVSRLLSHGWLEDVTMHVLRTRLIRWLQDADFGHRFHVYYPHVDGLKEGTCIDVHSKLMIVDDEVLRIGSANLCNRSMGVDSECDMALEARDDPRISTVIRAFRDQLLAEHLGLPQERVAKEVSLRGSLFRAIEVLRGPGRSLKPLDQVPEWSETAVELAQVADPERPVSLEEFVKEFRPDIPAPPERRARWSRLAMLALVLLALTALWRYTPLAGLLDPDRIIGWAHEFAHRPWAPYVIMLAYIPAIFVLFPRPLITLAAVVAFGTFPGVAYALTGILVAALVSYLVGRRLPRDAVRSLAGGEKIGPVVETLRRRGLLAMTAIRLVPVMPFAMVGLLAGAIGIRMWQFMLGTFFGMLPGTLVATVFGEQFEAALQDPSRISYGLIAAVIVVMALLTLAVRRWLQAQGRRRPVFPGKDEERHGQSTTHHPR